MEGPLCRFATAKAEELYRLEAELQALASQAFAYVRGTPETVSIPYDAVPDSVRNAVREALGAGLFPELPDPIPFDLDQHQQGLQPSRAVEGDVPASDHCSESDTENMPLSKRQRMAKHRPKQPKAGKAARHANNSSAGAQVDLSEMPFEDLLRQMHGVELDADAMPLDDVATGASSPVPGVPAPPLDEARGGPGSGESDKRPPTVGVHAMESVTPASLPRDVPQQPSAPAPGSVPQEEPSAESARTPPLAAGGLHVSALGASTSLPQQPRHDHPGQQPAGQQDQPSGPQPLDPPHGAQQDEHRLALPATEPQQQQAQAPRKRAPLWLNQMLPNRSRLKPADAAPQKKGKQPAKQKGQAAAAGAAAQHAPCSTTSQDAAKGGAQGSQQQPSQGGAAQQLLPQAPAMDKSDTQGDDDAARTHRPPSQEPQEHDPPAPSVEGSSNEGAPGLPASAPVMQPPSGPPTRAQEPAPLPQQQPQAQPQDPEQRSAASGVRDAKAGPRPIASKSEAETGIHGGSPCGQRTLPAHVLGSQAGPHGQGRQPMHEGAEEHAVRSSAFAAATASLEQQRTGEQALPAHDASDAAHAERSCSSAPQAPLVGGGGEDLRGMQDKVDAAATFGEVRVPGAADASRTSSLHPTGARSDIGIDGALSAAAAAGAAAEGFATAIPATPAAQTPATQHFPVQDTRVPADAAASNAGAAMGSAVATHNAAGEPAVDALKHRRRSEDIDVPLARRAVKRLKPTDGAEAAVEGLDATAAMDAPAAGVVGTKSTDPASAAAPLTAGGRGPAPHAVTATPVAPTSLIAGVSAPAGVDVEPKPTPSVVGAPHGPQQVPAATPSADAPPRPHGGTGSGPQPTEAVASAAGVAHDSKVPGAGDGGGAATALEEASGVMAFPPDAGPCPGRVVTTAVMTDTAVPEGGQPAEPPAAPPAPFSGAADDLHPARAHPAERSASDPTGDVGMQPGSACHPAQEPFPADRAPTHMHGERQQHHQPQHQHPETHAQQRWAQEPASTDDDMPRPGGRRQPKTDSTGGAPHVPVWDAVAAAMAEAATLAEPAPEPSRAPKPERKYRPTVPSRRPLGPRAGAANTHAELAAAAAAMMAALDDPVAVPPASDAAAAAVAGPGVSAGAAGVSVSAGGAGAEAVSAAGPGAGAGGGASVPAASAGMAGDMSDAAPSETRQHHDNPGVLSDSGISSGGEAASARAFAAAAAWEARAQTLKAVDPDAYKRAVHNAATARRRAAETVEEREKRLIADRERQRRYRSKKRDTEGLQSGEENGEAHDDGHEHIFSDDAEEAHTDAVGAECTGDVGGAAGPSVPVTAATGPFDRASVGGWEGQPATFNAPPYVPPCADSVEGGRGRGVAAEASAQQAAAASTQQQAAAMGGGAPDDAWPSREPSIGSDYGSGGKPGGIGGGGGAGHGDEGGRNATFEMGGGACNNGNTADSGHGEDAAGRSPAADAVPGGPREMSEVEQQEWERRKAEIERQRAEAVAEREAARRARAAQQSGAAAATSASDAELVRRMQQRLAEHHQLASAAAAEAAAKEELRVRIRNHLQQQHRKALEERSLSRLLKQLGALPKGAALRNAEQRSKALKAAKIRFHPDKASGGLEARVYAEEVSKLLNSCDWA